MAELRASLRSEQAERQRLETALAAEQQARTEEAGRTKEESVRGAGEQACGRHDWTCGN